MRKTVFLNTDREMPLLGLGVYKLTGENEVEQAIYHATQDGYRLIDTASAYANEEGVGRGVRPMRNPPQRTIYHNQDLEQCAAPWRY